MRSKETLRKMLKAQLLKAPVKLTSGKHSHFYIDCRPLVLDPYARVIVTSQIAQVLAEIFTIIPCDDFNGIGGPTFSGALMAVAFSNLISPYSLVIPFAYHTNKDTLIVPEGKITKVVILDDVLSTGGTLMRMYNRCLDRGWEVVCAAVIIDHQEEESNDIRKCFPILSVFTAKDINDEV